MNLEQLGLLDNRNLKLWESLSKTHNIVVKTSNLPYYDCYSQDNDSLIMVTENEYDPAYFTHELLHILLRQKEIFMGASFKLHINSNPDLSRILSENLLDHFGNCLDHIKMLPIYQNLGFETEKFLSDSDENKCTEQELRILKNGFKSDPYYNPEIVDFYFGKYISIKADTIPKANYKNCLEELRKMDEDLFVILDQFITNWEQMPLDKENIWDDDYHSILFDFILKLENWSNTKFFV